MMEIHHCNVLIKSGYANKSVISKETKSNL
jgi:hypothetical protein